MKAIIVTGTPATGKTTAAKAIAKALRLEYIDVNKVIDEHGLCESFDKARDCKVIDEHRLGEVLADMITASKKTLVIDSHMSHFIPKEHVELCVVTRCDLKELKSRLEARGYSPTKVKENMDAEIFDVCGTEAEEQGHDCIRLDTSEGSYIDDMIKDIKTRIKRTD